MPKRGVYLQSIRNVMEDKSVLIKHVIAQINEPNENGFADDPQIRVVYLKPDILPEIEPGTLVTFEIDTKIRKDKNGNSYEKIVPIEIRPLTIEPVDKGAKASQKDKMF